VCDVHLSQFTRFSDTHAGVITRQPGGVDRGITQKSRSDLDIDIMPEFDAVVGERTIPNLCFVNGTGFQCRNSMVAGQASGLKHLGQLLDSRV